LEFTIKRTIERESRKVLKMYTVHHPKSDTDRIYVKRKEGERGQLQTEATYKVEIIITAEYFQTKYIEVQFKNKEVTKKKNEIRIQL
jgi:hypothetical protein